jgi:outer membrane cobalamin receptor
MIGDGTLDLSSDHDRTDTVQLTGQVENLFYGAAADIGVHATRGRAIFLG